MRYVFAYDYKPHQGPNGEQELFFEQASGTLLPFTSRFAPLISVDLAFVFVFGYCRDRLARGRVGGARFRREMHRARKEAWFLDRFTAFTISFCVPWANYSPFC